jgi:hypothetical protein
VNTHNSHHGHDLDSLDCGHQSDRAAVLIAADGNHKEFVTRAGHTSVSVTWDRYGHLFPESDAALRDRLDELFVPVTEQRRNTTA